MARIFEIPCIFPVIRESAAAETGSMVTASATTQSGATGDFLAIAHKARELAGFLASAQSLRRLTR